MPADPPNPWAVLHDDAKTYITLATALLGVTATFADRLVSDDDIGRVAVVAGWVVLAISIGLSIYASGTVFGAMKSNPPPTNYNTAAGFLNIAVIALGLGAAALAFGAWRTSFETSQPTRPSPIAAARTAVAEMIGTDDIELSIDRFDKTPTNEFVISLTRSPQGSTYEVVVDADRHEVVSVEGP
jgi:hypothetical protein